MKMRLITIPLFLVGLVAAMHFLILEILYYYLGIGFGIGFGFGYSAFLLVGIPLGTLVIGVLASRKIGHGLWLGAFVGIVASLVLFYYSMMIALVGGD